MFKRSPQCRRTRPLRGATHSAAVCHNPAVKSAFRTQYGPPSVLSVQDLPEPQPADHELLIRVHAATVNRTDCGGLWGEPYIFRFFVGWPKPRHKATGSDFAGEVIRVGAKVTRFHVGDRIMGFLDTGLGSHSECLCIRDDAPMSLIPEGVSFVHAAASLEGGHYAINFLRKVAVKAGDRVLVNGATGAIGSAAIPMLKAAGAHVTAVCADTHFAAVTALGADRTIDYTRVSFVEQLRGETFPFIFDAVGKSTIGQCRPLLPRHGVYISSELGPYGQNPLLALAAPILPGPKVCFPLPLDIPHSITVLCGLLTTGWRPLIDREYPLEEVQEAFTYVRSGQKIGNVVLRMSAR